MLEISLLGEVIFLVAQIQHGFLLISKHYYEHFIINCGRRSKHFGRVSELNLLTVDALFRQILNYKKLLYLLVVNCLCLTFDNWKFALF